MPWIVEWLGFSDQAGINEYLKGIVEAKIQQAKWSLSEDFVGEPLAKPATTAGFFNDAISGAGFSFPFTGNCGNRFGKLIMH
jgi:hypothetical protein